MEFLNFENIRDIIAGISPSAVNLSIALACCEMVFQFFMRLAFPKRFKD